MHSYTRSLYGIRIDQLCTRIHVWAGIPYAEPPLRELRFAPPVALKTFPVPILNATAFGATCV
ncbi:carboxylesterase family protein, partial [Salmonella sp. SAL4355]|uniref:carboxylesterase family protein n=1 Tax=Salmonella sp. SAL4355 TaxID=3159876 RepID=UPI0039784DA9